MEAPEKIYLYQSDREGKEYEDEWMYSPWGEGCVEYTRTDYVEKVFIHTVNAWLAEIHRVCDITDENGYQIGLEKLRTSFKNYYIKGE